MSDTSVATPSGIDTAAIRAAARNLDDGAVTEGYQANRQEVITMLNGALATELTDADRKAIEAEIADLGRRCLAMELSPTYVDVAIVRWQAFTGRVSLRTEGRGGRVVEGSDGTRR